MADLLQWPEGAPGPLNVEIVDYHQEDDMTATPIHPGEHLQEALKELGMSAAELARNSMSDEPRHRY